MRNVALLIETSLASGRQILAGISRYLHERDDWTVSHQTGPLGALNPDAIKSWSGDGIIARVANRSICRIVREKRAAVVDVLGNVDAAGFPTVTCDETAISELVADDLVERGFRHFGFYGLADEGWSVRRRLSFEAMIFRAGGHTFSAHMVKFQEKTSLPWAQYVEQLASWVATQPKPFGVMVASDQFAPDLVEACRCRGLQIPEEVAIVGVDNDASFCEVCVPRLSSVMPAHEKIGYEAARLLARLMDGHTAPRAPIRIAPLGLEVRQSSDAWAVGDPAVSKAVREIRSRACIGVSVDEVARAAGLSRSVLQRRFQALLGKTVLQTIAEVRLVRAKRMLAHTDLPLLEVAERAGFGCKEYLGYVFRRSTGMTPVSYRSRARSLFSESTGA